MKKEWMLGWANIGSEGGHAAGRRLLLQLYRKYFSNQPPPIAVTERGKPFFVDSPVHFSISHTRRQVFCVLSLRPVGLDAEAQDRPIRPELAEKILSPGEKRQYDAAGDKRAALLKFWVLKEAAAKCAGTGLQGYPNQTDFSLDDPRLTLLDGCYVAVIEEQGESYAV